MSLWDTYYGAKELFPPKAQWTTANTTDLSGKVMLVTGGNTGIGKQTARVLLERNARVYIACRSPEKAQAAFEDLKKSTGKTDDDVRVLEMDLASLPTVKAAVDAFLSKENRLDVLFNSAGVMFPPMSLMTSHGHDGQFGTNLLGHFYLTQLLLPTLLASAKTSSDQHARIINLSSNGHWWAPPESQGGPVVYDTLVEGPARTRLGIFPLYTQSKAAMVIFSKALARKYGSQGIISISMNPGGIRTELQRYTGAISLWFLQFILYDISYGAINPIYAATTPEALQLNGQYLRPWALPFEPRADLSNEQHQEKLWEWCEGEVKKFAPN
ncbi:NAD-P-binding protein [Clavulina sp. PMI_390]|nr:NAD-P-binding protein [Clavulina sp. PMI_390]